MNRRITMLIDSLNSGGAQRQLCMLAILLKKHGFDVQVLTYHEHDFFKPFLINAEILVITTCIPNKCNRFFVLRKQIRESKPDVVISFLHRPNMIAELASLPRRNYGLITSERSLDVDGLTMSIRLRLLLHTLSDYVVTNSQAQREFLTNSAPWLKTRIKTIVNCVDLDHFKPDESGRGIVSEELKIIVVGRFEKPKNPFGLLHSIDIFLKKYSHINIVVDWYGNNFYQDGLPTAKSKIYEELRKKIDESGLSRHLRLKPPVHNIASLYNQYHALCLPSTYEGCSNVICEAMACGLPVMAGSVGDNTVLVEHNVSGFLFDPQSPESIADTFFDFASLAANKRRDMGKRGREMAEKILSPSIFVQNYLQIINDLIAAKNL